MPHLRTGRTPWTYDSLLNAIDPADVKAPLEVDILIIGAGITGAFLAEAFTRAGRQVLVVDKHSPQTASTMASTSLLQWEIDVPLSKLAVTLGFEKAAQIYRQSFSSVASIAALVGELSIPCDFRPRHALYLEGPVLMGAELREECSLRQRANLPSVFVETENVGANYGFVGRSAIRSGGNAEANPVLLARGLLGAAMARGARVLSPANAEAFDFAGGKTYVRIKDSGVEIIANTLLLATGYEMPDFVKGRQHDIVSTWAMCTVPQRTMPLWHEDDLIWNADAPYFYMRTTRKGEIIIGGGDENISNAAQRDALLPDKTTMLQKTLHALVTSASVEVSTAWTAFFGVTKNALPIIGAVPGKKNVWAAYGYGGNGITFSALASKLLRDAVLSGIPVDKIYAFTA